LWIGLKGVIEKDIQDGIIGEIRNNLNNGDFSYMNLFLDLI
jgi:hypothetical protein